MVLTHEELQATIEEFETTNEELQATNEEMETTNEELQATNEELETTNDELRARSNELQELTAELEGERLRLNEIIELAPFYLMVLRGPALTLDTFNPTYNQLLEGQLLRGRPLEQMLNSDSENNREIIKLAHQTYKSDRAVTSSQLAVQKFAPEDEPGQPATFVFKFVPSHDMMGKVGGVIIYASQV